MRDKNLNFIQFSDQIESFLKKKTHSIEILRRAVIDNPTFPSDDYLLYLPLKNLISLRGLAVLSYYIPETLGWKIRGYLEEQTSRLCFKDKMKLKLLLTSKENMLVYLYDTQEFSSHEIFGNLLGTGLKALNLMKITRKRTKVRKPQRKRGYDDKGSLRSPDRWLPSFDYTLTELQNEKEKKTDLHNRIYHYLEKHLREKWIFFIGNNTLED